MQEKSGDLIFKTYGVINHQLVHPAMVAKALKRSKNMLSRKQLEEIIKAWPDENGVSSNPEVYDQWIFSQNQYFVDKVYLALGTDRVDRLSEKQLNLLNNALYRLKASKSVFDITLEEIVGQYELVTEHISPRSLEIAVENYQKKQRMN